MFCSNCGNKISEEMLFCPNCGKKIEKDQEVKEEKQEIKAEEEKVVNKPPKQNSEKYKVIITQANNKLGLIQIIQQVKKVDLATAKRIVKELPITLFVGLEKEEAEQCVEVCKKSGVEATVKLENEKNPFEEFDEKTTTDEIKKIEKKNKIKTATIIELISTVLALIAVLFVIFLPLFFERITETIEGESVVVEKGYSLFNLCYTTIEKIFSGNFNFTSYYVFFDLIRIMIAVWAITLVVSAIKKTVEQTMHLVKFEEYYKREERRGFNGSDIVKTIKNNQSGSFWYQIISELVVLFILGGYDGIVIASIIVVGVMMLVGFILEKVAKNQKKKVYEN